MLTAGVANVSALAILLALTTFAAVFDMRHLRIPNGVAFAILIAGLAASYLIGVVDPASAIAGATLGGGLLLAVRQAFRALRGYDGLGLGDVKFVAAASTWTGLEGLPMMLLVACIAALIFVGVCRIRDGALDPLRRIPFGPFLGVGAALVGSVQMLSGLPFLDALDRFIPA